VIDAAARRPAPQPRLLGALRAAVCDLLGGSWLVLVANGAWGFGLLVVVALTAFTPLGLVLLPLLAIPTAGVFRLAALVVRGEDPRTGDVVRAWVRYGGRGLVVGVPILVLTVVLGTNLVTGLETGGLIGWSIATFAGWGLVATGVASVTVWPLIVDPARDRLPLRAVVRTALLLALAFPLRFGGLLLVLIAVLVVGTLAVVALLTIALGFAALVACRYVLPAADRLVPVPPEGEG
jgi:hypothetical protein